MTKHTQHSAADHPPLTPDRIRTRAYELYEARIGAGRDGDDLSDWIQAEQELSQQPAETSQTKAGSGSATRPR